ncbi:hypothetical protein BT69DRAFT_1302052 [Atractiella rhizophila]|nr:hypothetical protein BT69DRAFT_1302052 [Atractiella rhizophila]
MPITKAWEKINELIWNERMNLGIAYPVLAIRTNEDQHRPEFLSISCKVRIAFQMDSASPNGRLRSSSNLTTQTQQQLKRARPTSIYLSTSPSQSSPTLSSPANSPANSPPSARRTTQPLPQKPSMQSRRSSGLFSFPGNQNGTSSPGSGSPKSSPLSGKRQRLPSYATPSSPISINGSPSASKRSPGAPSPSPSPKGVAGGAKLPLPPSRLRKASTISSVLSNPPAPRVRLTSEEPPERSPPASPSTQSSPVNHHHHGEPMLTDESAVGSILRATGDGEGTMRAKSRSRSRSRGRREMTDESATESVIESLMDEDDESAGSGADETSQPEMAVRDEECVERVLNTSRRVFLTRDSFSL